MRWSAILGVVLAACAADGARPVAPASLAPPRVRLEPVPTADGAPWEKAYAQFRLINDSGGAIVRDGLGVGELERESLDGPWVPAPVARCATVRVPDPTELRLEPATSASVQALPPMGSEKVPPGRYRFAVTFARASQAEVRYQVAAYFEVRGLDGEESRRFLEAFSAPTTLECMGPGERRRYAERFAAVAEPHSALRLQPLAADDADDAETLGDGGLGLTGFDDEGCARDRCCAWVRALGAMLRADPVASQRGSRVELRRD